MNELTMRSRKKSEVTVRQVKEKHNAQNSVEHNKSSPKKKIYSNAHLPQKARKISNNLSLHLNELGREQ